MDAKAARNWAVAARPIRAARGVETAVLLDEERKCVSTELMTRARAGDEHAFRDLVEPHRRELLVHCYRMLGSLHDAEDAMQEAMLASWRGLADFEERSSLRTWLYRIATNRCLNALRSRRRRPPMRDLSFEPPEPTGFSEVPWLEPYPDVLLDELADDAPTPDVIYDEREAISLGFVSALQLLPPRQRAVLVLSDVLGYRAREVSAMLDATEQSVTSLLKRAHTTLQKHGNPKPSVRRGQMSNQPSSRA